MSDDSLPTEVPMPPEFKAFIDAMGTPVDKTRAWITAGVILGLGGLLGIVIGYWAGRADGLAKRR